MRAINAHIHIQFLNEHNLRGRDFWEEGAVTVSIWKVPNSAVAGAQRRPVGIRTLPMINGPRSGEGLYPGDVVEVSVSNPNKSGFSSLFLHDRSFNKLKKENPINSKRIYAWPMTEDGSLKCIQMYRCTIFHACVSIVDELIHE